MDNSDNLPIFVFITDSIIQLYFSVLANLKMSPFKKSFYSKFNALQILLRGGKSTKMYILKGTQRYKKQSESILFQAVNLCGKLELNSMSILMIKRLNVKIKLSPWLSPK